MSGGHHHCWHAAGPDMSFMACCRFLDHVPERLAMPCRSVIFHGEGLEGEEKSHGFNMATQLRMDEAVSAMAVAVASAMAKRAFL